MNEPTGKTEIPSIKGNLGCAQAMQWQGHQNVRFFPFSFQRKTSSKGISNSKRELRIERVKRIFWVHKILAICIMYYNFIKFYQQVSEELIVE